MKKRITNIFLLLCSVLGANAEMNFMTVELKDGNMYSFLLNDNLTVTYENGELEVNGNSSTSYAISSVKNYHFSEIDQTSVGYTSSDMLRIVDIDDHTIGVENAKAGAVVSLYSTNGSSLASSMTDQSGSSTITLPSTKGVYVLTVDNHSFKLIRK